MTSNYQLCHLLSQTLIASFLFLLTSSPLETQSLSFNFSRFDLNNPGIDFQGHAYIFNSQIRLTQGEIGTSTEGSMGRALYKTPIKLWDASTKRLTDFTTNFNFSIAQATSTNYGDGLTFILVPYQTQIPNDSSGGCLALFSQDNSHNSCVENQTIVAIEFDTYQNGWDPSLDHIGIDVNSIHSAVNVSVSFGLKNITAQAIISYNSTLKNLSVSLTVNGSLDTYSVSHIVNLSSVLPDRVQVGFSASTGRSSELHEITAWSFHSTLEETVASSPSPTRQHGAYQGRNTTNKGANKVGLIAGISAGVVVIIIFGLTIAWLRLQRKSPGEDNIEGDPFDISEDFNTETGPRKFAYFELFQATNNFAIEGKLGEGGFGGVYKGLLTGADTREIAVKKIKSGSNQGKKEYISEVKIISRLRHRNLVQLLGWCHDHGDLLLVYEFMPNGSLDAHLFGRKLPLLSWSTRHKIALGLASALLYLHEEWEQCVVHRDIKSSNVMLDLNFNAKLGDFGLARLADHDIGLQTTIPAGTPGYLAPECLMTGRASKESDVYSFGIVALEIACGRKVIEVKDDVSKVLHEWVWDLYGKGLILEAIDSRLEGEFDEQQAKCIMVVGLWCCHPDVSYRPSIRQAIAALNFETALPNLPPQLPVAIYVSPGVNMSLRSSLPSSSSMIEGNHPHTSTSSISTSTTHSSMQSVKSTSSTYPLLGSTTHNSVTCENSSI